MTRLQTKKIFKQILDIPQYKLRYILGTSQELIQAAFFTIKRYGVVPTMETFDIFYCVVNEIMAGTPEVDYEFQEDEYMNLMSIKPLIKGEKNDTI